MKCNIPNVKEPTWSLHWVCKRHVCKTEVLTGWEKGESFAYIQQVLATTITVETEYKGGMEGWECRLTSYLTLYLGRNRSSALYTSFNVVY